MNWRLSTTNPKRRRRIRIAIALLVAPFFGLPTIQLIASLTTDLHIPYWSLLGHLAITVLAVMGVELLLEGFSLRPEDLSEIESAIKDVRAKIEVFDNERLVKDIVTLGANEWESNQPLIAAKQLYGLDKIYSSRDECKAEILENLKTATKREKIWLLGITFSREFVLEGELLNTLREKHEQDVQVKILAANAIRSIAVFRTFLETSCDEVQKMVKETGGFQRYFDHRFYRKFFDLFDMLRKYARQVQSFQKVVRFYPHSPSCWMVRIGDKVIYYQPYVLGRVEDLVVPADKDEDARTIGDLMPVFKFVDADKKPFRSLINHFEKLWATSDVDLFHMGARVENKDFRLRRIFKERGPWFEHVVEALWVEEDRRAYPRKLYRKDPSHEVTVGQGNEDASEEWMYWTLNFSEGPLRALGPLKVIMEDVSYDGCALRVRAEENLRGLFKNFSDDAAKIQANVKFRTSDRKTKSYRAEYVPNLQNGVAILTPPNNVAELKELDYLVKQMRERSHFEFKIRNWNWQDDDLEQDLMIGLQYRRQARQLSNVSVARA